MIRKTIEISVLSVFAISITLTSMSITDMQILNDNYMLWEATMLFLLSVIIVVAISLFCKTAKETLLPSVQVYLDIIGISCAILIESIFLFTILTPIAVFYIILITICILLIWL